MRTTLTLDPDVARMLEEQVRRERKPLKHVVNEALRRGLTQSPGSPHRKPYLVEPHSGRLLPGLDARRLNALADELEDSEVVAKARVAERR